MRQILASLLVSIYILMIPAKAHADFQCEQQYQQKIQKFYKANVDDEDKGWVYQLKGYYWLSKVIGKAAAVFVVTFVPGAIPIVLSISTVAAFFDLLKKEKGIIGAYIVLKMSQFEEEQLANEDIDSKVEEEVLELQENKYRRETNLFNTFVDRVNRKYKNTSFTYEQVRQAVIEIAREDDKLCHRNGKQKFTTLNRMIKLTKKRLINQN